MPQSGADFFSCVSDRSGSDTRFWEQSRIVAERIPAATTVTERCGLIEPLRKKTLHGYIITPYTSLVIYHTTAVECCVFLILKNIFQTRQL